MGGRAKRSPLPKICCTYPTLMKLGTVIPYPKKIQKYMNHVTQPLSSADISIFSPEISKFCYIKKYRYRLHFDEWFLILLTLFESLKIFLIKMVTILMMPAKMATLGLHKIQGILNKRLWGHNSWRHKQNFITWIKSYCKYGHVTKVW